MELFFHTFFLENTTTDRHVKQTTRKNETLRGNISVIQRLATKNHSSILARMFLSMKKSDANLLYRTLDAKYFENNEILYTKGETSFRSMYIIVMGKIHIIQTSNEISKQGVLETKEVVVKECKNGAIIGDNEIMLNCSRQTTARCANLFIETPFFLFFVCGRFFLI